MRSIRELRDLTGLSQKAFADLYGIPVSTLRKWEQGEASPPEYLVRLLARSLPGTEKAFRQIRGSNGQTYYYSPLRNSVMDQKGNEILIREDLQGVKEQNLIVYLEELFEQFDAIQQKFNRDCYYDKQENILWTR